MIQQVQLQLVLGGLQKLLADALWTTTGAAYSGLLPSTFLGLLVGPYPGFSLDLTRADVVEATYDGYARVAAAWSTQGISPDGRPEVYDPGVLWRPTGSTTANLILAVGLFSALTLGTLYGVGVIPTPVQLASPADMANLVSRFQLPLDNADWGVSGLVA